MQLIRKYLLLLHFERFHDALLFLFFYFLRKLLLSGDEKQVWF